MARKDRQRIAVLGGGLGAMVAAFELTGRKSLRKRYEVTVYQMGWRLGGKGASGRNRDVADRIEEHGAHVYMGFYENAFRVMRQCYDELKRPKEDPLSRCFEGPNPAFRAHDHVTLTEQFSGEWARWELPFPSKPGLPGDQAMRLNGLIDDDALESSTPWSLFLSLAQWLVEYFDSNVLPLDVHRSMCVPRHKLHQQAFRAMKLNWRATSMGATHLHAATCVFHAAGTEAGSLSDATLRLIHSYLDQFISRLQATIAPRMDNADAKKMWITMRLGTTVLMGMIMDGVLLRGFDSIDDLDFTQWLRKHGATTRDVWWSAPVRGIYSLVFGFKSDNIRVPRLAAGTALRGILRMLFSFRGAVMWKMQAGMGDTVFAPLYRVLVKRGVRFKFFHRVEGLKLSADKTRIDTINLGIQATIKDGKSYDPIYTVHERDGRTLECWPSTPDYSQLDLTSHETDLLRELQQRGIDPFESAWTPWKNKRKEKLRYGKHFDIVVLGISVGALPYLCKPLIKANPRWKKMVKRVETIQTQAAQLWLNKNWSELGWKSQRYADAEFSVPPRQEEPMVGAFERPMDSWVGMSQLISRENFPVDSVKHVVYLFSVLEDSEEVPPPFTASDFPAQQHDLVENDVCQFLDEQAGTLWPHARKSDGFDWGSLVQVNPSPDRHPFKSQYWRANTSPSDRYVTSPPGSTSFRLRSDESGFDNLFLAGDWTRTGLNSGCAEAATMSGMQAARTICGYPKHVVGETDFGDNRLTRCLTAMVEAGIEMNLGFVSAFADALQNLRDKISDDDAFRLDANNGVLRAVAESTARFFEDLSDTIRPPQSRSATAAGGDKNAGRNSSNYNEMQPRLTKLVKQCIAAELAKQRAAHDGPTKTTRHDD